MGKAFPSHTYLYRILAAGLLGFCFHSATAQVSNAKLQNLLSGYFKQYTNSAYVNNLKYSLQRVQTNASKKTVTVQLNDVFGMQPFTPELVDKIYRDVALKLPSPYNTYTLSILTGGKDIRQLVTAAWSQQAQPDRKYGNLQYKGIPWVRNLSASTTPSHGLQGRHLSLWPSHGMYYANGEHKWIFQRPHLFCTTEDLLTQSIVVPFLYPMLENAGAILFTPRERDWQIHEVVVDNDFPKKGGVYVEEGRRHAWRNGPQGFSNRHELLTDFDNPHHEGTSRICETTGHAERVSTVTWTPDITETGNYAVYVTYPVMLNGVPDVQYQVCHAGIQTNVQVNQQMGGGTWVYLGTFDFTAGDPVRNFIRVSNHSNHSGIVAADAIRLGGGRSNVMRADVSVKDVTPAESTQPVLQYDYTNSLIGSAMPRHLEAARYSALWMGFSRELFSQKDGQNDYSDDILLRPATVNYMAGGSIFLPSDTGLCVPLELALGLHSDAGYFAERTPIGSLAIHTSDAYGGFTPTGLNRLSSRDLCDLLLQQVTKDITHEYGTWARRQIFDRNYGETRVPRIPAAILEMFSHQNFTDMTRALDPNFKFLLARSIYKGILRYIAFQHNLKGVVVEPLPVQSFSADADVLNRRIVLNWKPTLDALEPTAAPKSYIVYRRVGNTGWDNGTEVFGTTYSFAALPDVLYQFKVEAVNAGGRSLPSEELCARLSNNIVAPRILIVNGFQRLASPQPVYTAEACGFDMQADPGVPYLHTPEFAGRQLNFSWSGLGKEGPEGLGHSGSELEGTLVKGNTFDYPILHAQDILCTGNFSISSASRAAVEDEHIQLGGYRMVDLILGAQREDGYSKTSYKTFTPKMQNLLRHFTSRGGALLVSGAYVGTDMTAPENMKFTENVLHYTCAGRQLSPFVQQISGMGVQCSYQTTPNAQHLSTPSLSILRPTSRAFATMVYADNRQCAATAYKGADYAVLTLGFPIEQIKETNVRRNIMAAVTQFLLSKK